MLLTFPSRKRVGSYCRPSGRYFHPKMKVNRYFQTKIKILIFRDPLDAASNDFITRSDMQIPKGLII